MTVFDCMTVIKLWDQRRTLVKVLEALNKDDLRFNTSQMCMLVITEKNWPVLKERIAVSILENIEVLNTALADFGIDALAEEMQ